MLFQIEVRHWLLTSSKDHALLCVMVAGLGVTVALLTRTIYIESKLSPFYELILAFTITSIVLQVMTIMMMVVVASMRTKRDGAGNESKTKWNDFFFCFAKSTGKSCAISPCRPGGNKCATGMCVGSNTDVTLPSTTAMPERAIQTRPAAGEPTALLKKLAQKSTHDHDLNRMCLGMTGCNLHKEYNDVLEQVLHADVTAAEAQIEREYIQFNIDVAKNKLRDAQYGQAEDGHEEEVDEATRELHDAKALKSWHEKRQLQMHIIRRKGELMFNRFEEANEYEHMNTIRVWQRLVNYLIYFTFLFNGCIVVLNFFI